MSGSIQGNLAEDVTFEGTAMNAVLRGREAVSDQLDVVIGFYEDKSESFSVDTGEYIVRENHATVDGRPIKAILVLHRNPEGQFDRVIVTHRPLSAALTFSRLVGESRIGAQSDPNRFYRPTGQTYQDLLDYADRNRD
jgi:hypothetical protein